MTVSARGGCEPFAVVSRTQCFLGPSPRAAHARGRARCARSRWGHGRGRSGVGLKEMSKRVCACVFDHASWSHTHHAGHGLMQRGSRSAKAFGPHRSSGVQGPVKFNLSFLAGLHASGALGSLRKSERVSTARRDGPMFVVLVMENRMSTSPQPGLATLPDMSALLLIWGAVSGVLWPTNGARRKGPTSEGNSPEH